MRSPEGVFTGWKQAHAGRRQADVIRLLRHVFEDERGHRVCRKLHAEFDRRQSVRRCRPQARFGIATVPTITVKRGNDRSSERP